MSELQQLKFPPPAPAAGSATTGGRRAAAWLRQARWAVLGLSWPLLAACSDDGARRENSELRVEQPAAGSSAPAATTADPAPAADPPEAMTRRYRVTAETAYFFDSPQQTRPGGHYLRRGDVVYGTNDTNGFVRTRFVGPDGTTVTGWLKAEELSLLSLGAAATRPAPSARPAPAEPYEEPAVAEPYEEPAVAAEPSRASGAQTVAVQAARSYFYNDPGLIQMRKAHCVRGDKVRLGQQQGDAVYVTFTNWEKVTSTGWMRKDALGLN